MKKAFYLQIFLFRFLFGLAVLIISCNKKFEAPPINQDPDIAVTMTIGQLKATYQGAGMFKTVDEDKIISGIVIADDKSGNFYKQIVIQDSTGGIPIQIDMNSIYTSFPVGRRVYVKLKGLMLGDYGGNIQLGLDSTTSASGYLNIGRIPELLLNQYVIGGSYGNVVTPKVIKPSDFTGSIANPLLSTLVQIKNAEFRDADISKTYGNAASPASESARNFTIKPCDDTKSIVLRNSSYASFAGITVPNGNGILTGVPSVFNGTLQIAIRDTSDVAFAAVRCNGQTPVTSTKTIAEVLSYAKGDSTIPAGIMIEGVVISDTKNEAAGNYRLQDATGGIQLRFTTAGNPNAATGDKLQVNVGGLKLSIFSGGLQINNVTTSTKLGTATITPRAATVASIAAAGRNWESQLVTIKDVTISGSGSNYIIKDATGELVTFVRATSGIIMPTAATAITGYVSLYQATATATLTPQFVLRSQADIVGGTTTPPETGSASGISLGNTSPFILNFDNIGNGLPTGVKIYTAAKADAIGTEATLTTSATVWNNVSGAFKNFASATGLSATATTTEQNNSTNRALGIRQTGSFGDPGAAFTFILNNTTGKSNLKVDFLLQQLDASASGRTVTWTIDYSIGENPTSFTALTSATVTLGSFTSNGVSVTLPATLSNLSSKVWIRIVTLSASTGGSNRPSTGIDDFKISW